MPTYKRNKDGYFRATITTSKDIDGKTVRKNIRDKDLKTFKLKLADAERLHRKGILLDDMTVHEWSMRWIQTYKANATSRQQAHYQAKLNYDILPAIGDMYVKDVRNSHLQDILNQYNNGRAGTVTKIRIALQQLFEDAETEGIIDRNPARRLELPMVIEKNRRPLTDNERMTVYQTALTHQHGLYALIMLFCGLRRGECISVRVQDIDFDKKRIYIDKRTVFDGNKGNEKEGTKSKQNVRVIPKRYVPIPSLLEPHLMHAIVHKAPGDLLITKKDGKRATKQACRVWWSSFLRKCHVTAGAHVYRNKVDVSTSSFDNSITPHYLRHTYATALYDADISDSVQKAFMGHSSKDISDVYRKMTDKIFNRALDLLNGHYSELKWGM